MLCDFVHNAKLFKSEQPQSIRICACLFFLQNNFELSEVTFQFAFYSRNCDYTFGSAFAQGKSKKNPFNCHM